MPRQIRRKSYSSIYHCMLRGINQQDIFYEEKDYLKFQDIIRKTKKNYLYQLYSYVLMPNHIHLEIKDENQKVSQIIHCIGTSYANYFNKKYKRKGHLFESRFLSKNVENIPYMLNLVRYIHQNPLKAGINEMENYRWSSFFEYFKSEDISKEDKIVDTQEVLEIFLPKKEETKKAFLEFNKKNWKFYESSELLEYEMKNRLTDEEVIYFIKEEIGIYNIQDIQKYNNDYRNELIRKIIKIKGVTQVQVARILGLTVRVIQNSLYQKNR
ncbi:MAG: transposase [Clostridia bacterium]|nr:transposase [Clostridia bacterium]